MFCWEKIRFLRPMKFLMLNWKKEKKKLMTSDSNDMAYTELILSFDDKTSSGQIS